MNRRPCTCRYCGTPVQTEAAPVVHPPVELPAEPRAFRVHHDGRTQDCTLHPDGRLTMTRPNGEVLTSMLSFDEMRERNWEHAQIEWDPAPLAEESEPEAASVAEQIPLAV